MKNYTRTWLMAILYLFTLTAAGQPKAGIRAGLNYGGFSGYTEGKKTAAHIGVFLQWSSAYHVKIQPELNFQRVVQGYISDLNETPVESTLAVSFAALPLMIQYYPTKNFYVEAGPQFSVITGASNSNKGGPKTSVKRDLGNTQFGVNAGLGMDIRNKLGFYLRYQAGLSDITLYDNNKDCVRLLQAGVTVKFK